MSGDGRTFRYLRNEPLWYFGSGESYASFTYSDLIVSRDSIAVCGSITLTVTVTRGSGDPAIDALPADEIVELFVATEVASAPPSLAVLPRLRLADFTRVRDVHVSESQTLTFSLTPDDMAVVNAANRAGWEVHPGSLRICRGRPPHWEGGWVAYHHSPPGRLGIAPAIMCAAHPLAKIGALLLGLGKTRAHVLF
jgi:beta-glucosidase